MIEEQYTLSKDQAFRLFDQSELSDFIHDDENVRTKILGNFKRKTYKQISVFIRFARCECACWNGRVFNCYKKM